MSVADDLVRVPNPFMDMLLKTRVNQVRGPSPVKFLRATNTMADVVLMLQQHSVLSFPVLDDDDDCLGLVDGLDVVRFLQNHAGSYTGGDISDMLNSSVEHFINASQVNPYIPVFSTSSLHAVITILAPGCHRTVAFESEGSYTLYCVFSESDLIAHLHRYLGTLPPAHPASRAATLPINCFSSHISRPSHSVFLDEPLSAATRPISSFRAGDTGAPATAAAAGDSFDFSSMLVAVFDRETGCLAGHLDASTVKGIVGATAAAAGTHAAAPSTAGSAAAAAAAASDAALAGGATLAAAAVKAGSLLAKVGEALQDAAADGTDSGPAAAPAADAAAASPAADVHASFSSRMELTVGAYLSTFVPSALGGWAVPDDVPFGALVTLLTQRRLHHVWVVAGLREPQPVAACGPALRRDAVLGVVTLNDALRWIARDNLWLRTDRVVAAALAEEHRVTAGAAAPADATA